MQKRFLAVLALGAVAATAAGLAGRGSGSEATPAAGGPDSRTQPVSDGCTRDRGAILKREAPNWVYVGGTTAAQNQMLTGIVDSKYQPERAAEPTGTDDPFTHTSYDFTFNVEPDPAYENLMGTGNAEGTSSESGRLHIERESGSFPMWAWPDRGDRVTLAGSWVWDCDHTTASGEHTEIHPFRILWVERNPGGASPHSSAGDSEADLFITAEATPADRQAVCALETKANATAFKQCVLQLPPPLPPPGAPLSFTLKAPKKPSPKARLVYHVLNRLPPNKITVKKGTSGIRVTVAPTLAAQASFFVGWRPVETPPVHLRVHFDSLLVRRAMDPGCPPYDPNCPAKDESTLLGQVTTSPGEWNVYMDTAGVWKQWLPKVLQPQDGQTIKGKQSVDLYVTKGKPWRLFVQTRECDFGSLGNAYSNAGTVSPCPRLLEVGNTVSDDQPGVVAVHFRSPTASLGTHRVNSSLDGSTCPASNKHGCYRLTFTVSRIRP